MGIEIENDNYKHNRGLCILPSSLDPSDTTKQLLPFYLTSDLNFHFICLNHESINDYGIVEKNTIYCHLIDSKGKKVSIPIDKKLLIFVMVSCYFISRAENTTIIPSFKQLFPKSTEAEASKLDLKLRKYFMDIVESLCVFFQINDFEENDNSATNSLDWKYLKKEIVSVGIKSDQDQIDEVLIYKGMLY